MSDENSDISTDTALSFIGLFADMDGEKMKKLFPDTPPEYFEQFNDDEIFKKQPKNPIDVYNELPVRPIIRNVDLNNSEEEPDLNKSKNAIEIGLTFDF